MSTVFYITGTSRGLGLALANTALALQNTKVIGISRNQTLSHKNYQHIQTDLSLGHELENLSLPVFQDAKRVILINNAGMLGEVAPFGQQSNQSILQTHTLNAIAPAVLTNWILHKYSSAETQIVILNISSGAGRYPVHSWGNYCSSKASIDMLSQVVALENKDRVKVFAVAPGIIDTQMQSEIRESSLEKFPDLQRFIAYKEEGMLSQSQEVAEKLMFIALNPQNWNDTLLDVRKL